LSSIDRLERGDVESGDAARFRDAHANDPALGLIEHDLEVGADLGAVHRMAARKAVERGQKRVGEDRMQRGCGWC
jgi:hypothetical protein